MAAITARVGLMGDTGTVIV